MISPGPVRFWERPLARLRASSVHESEPRRRPGGRRFAKGLLSAALWPVSAAGRLVLALRGRSGPLDPARIRRIAFIKLDHIGDAVMATPLLRAIHAWAPGAKITVYARPQSAELFARLPAVSGVEAVDVPWIRPDSSPWANLRACLALAGRIRRRGFDLAVDLRYHNRLDSLLLSLCGARSTLGFDAGGFGFGITHRSPLPRSGHEIGRCAGALQRFGVPVADLATEFPGNAEAGRHAERLAGAGAPIVAIHPGAGNPIKRWMPERFAAVARELAGKGRVRIAVLGGPGEEGLGEPIVRAVPQGALLDLRGQLSLFGMAAFMGRCALVIGNDGGPTHVAAAVGVPTLVLFSGTSLASEWAPRGGKVRVIEKQVPCKPCHSTTCPFDQACLRMIGVDEVVRCASSLRGGGKTGGSRLK